jgi:HD-GYP domain-containing protein (c-di-GMP phosphodiesterase class II)
VFIEDNYTFDIFPDEVINEETRRNALVTIQNTMKALVDRPSIFGLAATPKLGSIFRKVCGDIMKDIELRQDIMINLQNLYVKDDYLFHQSINVTVLAIMIGISKGYSKSQIEDLGVGALMFDIGMVNTPKYLWNKKTALTTGERVLIQNHTLAGYELLSSQVDIDPSSAHCALEHHERYDGSGYPNGLKGEEIHEFAQIIAIADVYSALTSVRAYRHRYTPGEAIEYLLATGNSHFNLEIIKLFCNHISIYPVASTVRLNTGEIGVVSAIHQSSVHRPVIRIIKEANGTPTRSAREVDLLKHMNITIVSTL